MAKANQFYPQEVEINQIQNSDGDTVLDVVNETVAADVIHVDEDTNVETTLVDINEMHVNADVVYVDNTDPDNPVTTNIIDADTQTVNATTTNTTTVNSTTINATTVNGDVNGSTTQVDIKKVTDDVTVKGSVEYISETDYNDASFTPDPDTLYLIHE